MNSIGDQCRIDLTKVAIGAARKKRQSPERKYPPSFGWRRQLRQNIHCNYSALVVSTRDAATAAAACAVPGVGFKAVRSIRIAINTNDRKNNDGRRLRIGVDVLAAARAYLVRKSDDLAHCSPLSAPARDLLGRRFGAFWQLKDLQG